MSPSLDVSPVPFRDAVARFRAFLKGKGRPEAVVWIKPDDLVQAGSRLYVRLRDPNRRWMDAQCTYETGLDRKMGIVLRHVCQVPGLSCCQVMVPPNSGASGVTFSAPDTIRWATPVVNRLFWAWVRLRGRAGA